MSHHIGCLILIVVTALLVGCGKPEPAIQLSQPLPHAVNINTASLEELQKIPHIGESLARRIVDHREANGPFRRVEHLMLVSGISDKRFRKIRPLVRVE
jgi:competence protein ComEA